MLYSLSYKGHMIHGSIQNDIETIKVQLFGKLVDWNNFKIIQVKSIHAAKCLITRYVNSNNG